MNQVNLFLELTRLKKPIGYMLLFWPCAWGLTIAYDFSSDLKIYFFYLSLFFLGSVLMRSAGCIVNDILDRKFDRKVSRTKERPIAAGEISPNEALLLFFFLVLCAACLLLFMNLLTFLMALLGLGLATFYPISKRFFPIPQVFLGLAFCLSQFP